MLGRLLLVGSVLALLAMPASAQWSDNFDSYAVDSSLHGQGGWKGWDNSALATAYVRDEYSLSAPHSVEVAGPTDLIQEFGYAGGVWTMTAMQYIPGNMTGQSWFILQNQYNDGGPYNWSVQMQFENGNVTDVEVPGVSLPIVYDQWIEVRVEIDLVSDLRETYYNGALLGARTWTTDENSLLEIGALDLFANGATAVYYDDISLVPEPAAGLLLLIGALALRRR